MTLGLHEDPGSEKDFLFLVAVGEGQKCWKRVGLIFKGLSNLEICQMARSLYYQHPRYYPFWRQPCKLLAAWEKVLVFRCITAQCHIWSHIMFLYTHLITEWMNEWMSKWMNKLLSILPILWIWNSHMRAPTWQSLGGSDCSFYSLGFPRILVSQMMDSHWLGREVTAFRAHISSPFPALSLDACYKEGSGEYIRITQSFTVFPT